MRSPMRFWPVLVVGAVWFTFLLVRAFVSPERANETTTVPQFYELKRTVVTEQAQDKTPPAQKRALENAANPHTRKIEAEAHTRVPPPSPAPESSSVPEIVAEMAAPSQELPKQPAAAHPASPPTEVRPISTPVTEIATVPALPEAPSPEAPTAQISPSTTTSVLSDEPSVSMTDLPKVAERTLKGAMLTIEIHPPTGVTRDRFLTHLGARRVNDAQLWDTNVIARFELSGQVYVFRLSDGGRVLLPPMILSRIISELEKETKGAPLYRGRIHLGPMGQVTVKEVEVL